MWAPPGLSPSRWPPTAENIAKAQRVSRRARCRSAGPTSTGRSPTCSRRRRPTRNVDLHRRRHRHGRRRRSGGVRQAAATADRREGRRRAADVPRGHRRQHVRGGRAARASPRSAAARSAAIGGEQTPQTVALELLNEIAQPGLRDLKVEFRGVKVAAVYPERLPNVPAGTQQILVGRYLPEGRAISKAKSSSPASSGSEPVALRGARSRLKDAEEGNSFIPRLWARVAPRSSARTGAKPGDPRRDHRAVGRVPHHHAVHVAAGAGDRRRPRAVRREAAVRNARRRAVLRRRQGNANYELLQQQMKRAGDWRLGLRRQVLRQLATLGRDPRDVQRRVQALDQLRRRSVSWSEVGGSGQVDPHYNNLSLIVDGDYDQLISRQMVSDCLVDVFHVFFPRVEVALRTEVVDLAMRSPFENSNNRGTERATIPTSLTISIVTEKVPSPMKRHLAWACLSVASDMTSMTVPKR